MEKRFERYFGSNIARKFYIAGLTLIVIGVIVAFVYWAGYGVPIAAIGMVIFFISSAFQVSDNDIDQRITGVTSDYLKEKVEGKTIGKTVLESKGFSVFNGFVCEGEVNRFKTGSDGKLRTSKFFVTALSVEKNDIKVFTTVYDLLSSETPQDRCIYTKGAEEIEFTKEPTEFPKGNFKCSLKTLRQGESEILEFYLPDDALVDKLSEKIR